MSIYDIRINFQEKKKCFTCAAHSFDQRRKNSSRKKTDSKANLCVDLKVTWRREKILKCRFCIRLLDVFHRVYGIFSTDTYYITITIITSHAIYPLTSISKPLSKQNRSQIVDLICLLYLIFLRHDGFLDYLSFNHS